MIKKCCCTGHRPKGFPFAYGIDMQKHKAYLQALENKIRLAIRTHGINYFISGMAIGVDMDFAEIVLNLRDTEHYPITLECAIPDVNQTLKWTEKDKKRYTSLLERADEKNYISGRNVADTMLKRNRYMVDKSELVIAVFNGIQKGGTWYTISYAQKKNREIELIDLSKVDK